MALEEYKRKRKFDETSEPSGGETSPAGDRFVVHEHHATRLHFDLRLEMDGVLKSWAIPKGPSMNPADKRLAVMVEDHPLEYITFRGEIGEGNYGAGQVEIWDSGTWKATEGSLEQGKLGFDLFGAKLKGNFALVKLRNGKSEWLLIKHRDEFADPDWKLEQIVAGGSRKDLEERRANNQSEPAEGSDPMPRTVSPMLAELADKPFSDPEWVFEQKWDGYRALSFIEKGGFRFISRRNEDMTERFPQASAIPGLVNAHTAILDGEIVVLDQDGKPSFQLLQNQARSLPHGTELVYCVFDLLYLNGSDLRRRPLIERKELLHTIIRPGGFLNYSDHVAEKGRELFEMASSAGLEGIMAKRAHSPYVEGRSSHWLKIKTTRRQEVVICGYTEPRGSRESFGALVIGVYVDGELTFAGQVGTGFDDATLRELYETMQQLKADARPFASAPKTNAQTTWIAPELVCEVKFAEWTDEGVMRQPVYLGLRPDKQPTEAVRETAQKVSAVVEQPHPNPGKKAAIPVEELFERRELKGDVHVSADSVEVALTHLDKPYWPKEGYSKGDLLRYYYAIRETILPHIAGRPLILRRFPNGIDGESFYQHNLDEAPEFVRRVPVTEEGATVHYAVADSLASLLYVVNLGCIAQNPFSSRFESLEHPDWIVLDLDPEEAPFDSVCQVAMAVKGVLDEVGLVGWPKTSGARGMHIYVPIEGVYTHKQAQDVGRLVASVVASREPKIATIERTKKERTAEQVYVDFMQNGSGKSLASAYSVRAYPGATVSTPLTWEEVESGPDRGQFTMLTVPDRVSRLGDLFREVLTHGQKLAEPTERLAKLLTAVK